MTNWAISEVVSFLFTSQNLDNPTKSNKKCRIPFVYNKIEYRYCASVKAKFQCETVEDGLLDDCATGSFLYSRSSLNGDPYESYMQAPLGNKRPGVYDAEFYVSMSCDNSACAQANDYVSLSIVYSSSSQVNEDLAKNIKSEHVFSSVSLGEVGDQNTWVKFSGVFELQDQDGQTPSVIHLRSFRCSESRV